MHQHEENRMHKVYFDNLDHQNNQLIRKLAVGSVYALNPSELRMADRKRDIITAQQGTDLSKKLYSL